MLLFAHPTGNRFNRGKADKMIELHPEFLTKDGKKEFAVIPYEEFLKLQEILEDMEDSRDLRLAEEEDSPDYSLDEVRKILNLP